MKNFRTHIILYLLVFLSLSITNVKAKSPIKQLIERAEGGNADDQYRLSDCYSYGYGVKRDTVRARYWKNMAQKNGCVLASKIIATRLNTERTLLAELYGIAVGLYGDQAM